MYKLSTILKRNPVFLNLFANQEDVFNQFGISDTSGIKILFASYVDENYSGDAWVLFSKRGELYEVNGSHCSCYGLEGQWEPELVSLPELENRIKNGTFGTLYGNDFRDCLIQFLGIKFLSA